MRKTRTNQEKPRTPGETVGTYEKQAKIGETMIKQEKPGGKL